ncbi:hypothetical protein VIGAN_08113400 [Vigna angularis var. angularis]|nr:hypothetical protein VIGAN_08113400 [Vigna angularis var. angularis]
MILVPVSILKGSSEVDREFKELPNVLNFEIKGACDVDREFKEVFFSDFKFKLRISFFLQMLNYFVFVEKVQSCCGVIVEPLQFHYGYLDYKSLQILYPNLVVSRMLW